MPRNYTFAATKKLNKLSFSSIAHFVTIALCLSVLLLQNSISGEDIFFGILSFRIPFLHGVNELENIESKNENNKKSENTNDASNAHFLMELVGKSEIKSLALKSSAPPTILIYHTHATEAYTPTKGFEYEETTSWRTNDASKSIVAVGDTLCELLRSEYGFNVIHDTTNHEPPKLATSYSRSVVTMEKYKEKYPSIEVFIDVHRDAYGKDEGGLEDIAIIDGKECARLMFVVGTGEGSDGKGYDEMPDFDSNYALADEITTFLNSFDNNLTRKIRVKTGRYNQHISNKCLLVEVGHNANSLEQALNSTKPLAEAIAKALLNDFCKLDFSA